MGFVDKHLLPGESVSFRTHLHWKVYVMPALLAVVLGAPFVYAMAQTQTKALVLIPLFLVAVMFFVAYLQRAGSEFAVTNKRVIIKVGVLSTRSVELLLQKIEDITVNQTLMGRMLGYGEIVVTGTGGTKEQFAGIQGPFDFRTAVQAATDPGR